MRKTPAEIREWHFWGKKPHNELKEKFYKVRGVPCWEEGGMDGRRKQEKGRREVASCDQHTEEEMNAEWRHAVKSAGSQSGHHSYRTVSVTAIALNLSRITNPPTFIFKDKPQQHDLTTLSPSRPFIHTLQITEVSIIFLSCSVPCLVFLLTCLQSSSSFIFHLSMHVSCISVCRSQYAHSAA